MQDDAIGIHGIARNHEGQPRRQDQQRESNGDEEIRPGEVVWFPPGVRHWHGAAPATAMTHIAIQEQLDGKVVDWMEQVNDDQYRAESH